VPFFLFFRSPAIIRLLTYGQLWINNHVTVRILQISSSRTYGGGERHFVDLCRGLQQKGHQVFAALRPTNVWQDRLGFLPSSNILHVSIRNSFGILSANKMAGFVRDKEIEIVHAHVARDYIPASIACTLSGRAKFVLTRHVLFSPKTIQPLCVKEPFEGDRRFAGCRTCLKESVPAPADRACCKRHRH
jgi:hypothetical protein